MVLVQKIREYNGKSIHFFCGSDAVIFDLLLLIDSCFRVKFIGGWETIIHASRLSDCFFWLKKNHPDWKYGNYNNTHIDHSVKILRKFKKNVRFFIDRVTIEDIDSLEYTVIWNYVTELYQIIEDGISKPVVNS